MKKYLFLPHRGTFEESCSLSFESDFKSSIFVGILSFYSLDCRSAFTPSDLFFKYCTFDIRLNRHCVYVLTKRFFKERFRDFAVLGLLYIDPFPQHIDPFDSSVFPLEEL